MLDKLSDDKIKSTTKKMKANRGFKKRVQWYQLGQRRCHCCGVQMTWGNNGEVREASVEHLVPVSKGGTYDWVNIIITCRGCNNSRGTKDWIDFVTKNKFPKSEWLIGKYLNALEFYRKTNKVINIKLYNKARAYKIQLYKEQMKKAA
jgi:hypothetical protein